MDIFNDPHLAELIRDEQAEVVGTCPHCGHDVYPSQLYPKPTDVPDAAESRYSDSYAWFHLDDWVRISNAASPLYNQTGRIVNFEGSDVKLELLRSGGWVWIDATEIELIVERRPVPHEELL